MSAPGRKSSSAMKEMSRTIQWMTMAMARMMAMVSEPEESCWYSAASASDIPTGLT